MNRAKRFAILRRDGFSCRYCGRRPPEAKLHVDHLIAVVNGGSDDEGNLITACSDCNLGKGPTDVSAACKKCGAPDSEGYCGACACEDYHREGEMVL